MADFSHPIPTNAVILGTHGALITGIDDRTRAGIRKPILFECPYDLCIVLSLALPFANAEVVCHDWSDVPEKGIQDEYTDIESKILKFIQDNQTTSDKEFIVNTNALIIEINKSRGQNFYMTIYEKGDNMLDKILKLGESHTGLTLQDKLTLVRPDGIYKTPETPQIETRSHSEHAQKYKSWKISDTLSMASQGVNRGVIFDLTCSRLYEDGSDNNRVFEHAEFGNNQIIEQTIRILDELELPDLTNNLKSTLREKMKREGPDSLYDLHNKFSKSRKSRKFTPYGGGRKRETRKKKKGGVRKTRYRNRQRRFIPVKI